jgi:hypothetical protein
MRYERRSGTHTSRCSCGLTAGVAAANHNDVESIRHQNPERRVLAEAREGVKITVFIENVSRETLHHAAANLVELSYSQAL